MRCDLSVSPCKYPECKDVDGNPTLTDRQFCERCAGRFKRLLEDIADAYRLLKSELPKPMVTIIAARAASKKGFGHPREWASNLAQELTRVCAQYVAAFHQQLWGHEIHTAFGQPIHTILRKDESRLMNACQLSMAQNFDALTEWEQCADLAEELSKLYGQYRYGTGATKLVRRLIAPCPKCDVRALTTREGSGTIECASCFHRFAEDDAAKNTDAQLARQQRYNYNTIDWLLDEYDATAPPSDQSPAPGQ